MPKILLTNYKIQMSIGISNVGGTWTYAPVSEGIDNLSTAWNDVVQQFQFLANQGWSESHVTGAAPVITISGRRVLGDAAQDYIASCKGAFDAARESSFKISYVDASSGVEVTPLMTVPCTFVNIVDIGGGVSTDKSVFSVEIHTKGKPTFTNVASLPALAVVSVAGSTVGKTAIYVNPALTGSDTYMYSTGSSVVLPELNAAPGSAYSAWDGIQNITAITGNQIAIVEVDASGFAVKGGTAIVTAMA